MQFIGNGEKKLNIVYEDDGIGFDSQKPKSKGLGLNNIHNRLELLNGKMQIDTSKETKGTTIFIDVEL